MALWESFRLWHQIETAKTQPRRLSISRFLGLRGVRYYCQSWQVSQSNNLLVESLQFISSIFSWRTLTNILTMESLCVLLYLPPPSNPCHRKQNNPEICFLWWVLLSVIFILLFSCSFGLNCVHSLKLFLNPSYSMWCLQKVALETRGLWGLGFHAGN